MICFTIALRSPHSTEQWNSVLYDFNNTLHSVFNQTCDEFRVYVGCNEVPTLFERYDDRLQFLVVNTPIPNTWEEKCRDRAWKLLACAREIKKDMDTLGVVGGGTFVFPVDADDYVSCHIAEFVKKHPEANGFKSSKGYCWVKGQRYMEKTPYFGGTMNIMKMYSEELPDELPDEALCFDKDTSVLLDKCYPIRWYDIEVEEKMSLIGRPMYRLPFYSTIYVKGTGANISEKDPAKIMNDVKRFHPIAFIRRINPFNKKLLTQSIKKEFGMRL